MAGIDMNRGTDGVVLPSAVSSEIWADTQEASAVMALARQINLPGPGVTIPIITGDPQADWVAETGDKPVSASTLSSKQITPYKVAVIELISDELMRDLPALYAELRRRLPGAIAKKFDSTVFGTTPPGSNFDTLGSSTAIGLSPHASNAKLGTYSGLVAAYQAVAAGGGALDGWALSSQAKGLLLGQIDTTGRPLLFDSIQNGSAIPQLLGEDVYYTEGVHTSGSPNTIGFAGDWSSAVYGTVEGIKFSTSKDATVRQGTTTLTASDGETTVDVPNYTSMFQANMTALLVEAEIGFRVTDAGRFVKLTDAVRS